MRTTSKTALAQTLDRLKVFAVVALIVGGMYWYADVQQADDASECGRTYFPPAVVQMTDFDDETDAGTVAAPAAADDDSTPDAVEVAY